jgi:hypothetical protein
MEAFFKDTLRPPATHALEAGKIEALAETPYHAGMKKIVPQLEESRSARSS